LILALLSEFNEFPEFNAEARNLLLIGGLFIGVNILIAGTMLYKYARKQVKITDSVNA